MQWEYKTVTHPGKASQKLGMHALDESRVEELNELGSDGWELVTVVPLTRDDILMAVTYVFKRQSQWSAP